MLDVSFLTHREEIELVCQTASLRRYFVSLMDFAGNTKVMGAVRACGRSMVGHFSALSGSLSFRKYVFF